MKLSRMTFPLLLAMLISLLPAAVGLAADRDELIKKVVDAAGLAHSPPGYGTDPSPYGKACAKAVDDAIAGGVTPDTEIQVPIIIDEDWTKPVEGGGFRLVTLANIKEHICVPAFAKGFISKASQAASRAATWLDKYLHPNGTYGKDIRDIHLIKLSIDEAKECRARVQEATGSGVPATTMLEFFPYDSGLKSPMALSDVPDQLCKVVLGYGQKAQKDYMAREAALYAPFLKALKGDKLRIFKQYKVLDYRVRGHGGRELVSPGDFAGSNVWYTAGYDFDKLIPTWSVDGWKFSGAKLAGTYRNSGFGSDYPANAFP